MAAKLEDFVDERAQILAKIALTRDLSLVLDRPSPDTGIDLLVTVKSRDVPGALFGVEVKGFVDMDQALSPTRDQLLDPLASGLARRVRNAPFPVGVLLFDMRTDEGYFGWVLRPSVNGRAAPELELVDRVAIFPLDESSLKRIVQDVERWYSARPQQRPIPA